MNEESPSSASSLFVLDDPNAEYIMTVENIISYEQLLSMTNTNPASSTSSSSAAATTTNIPTTLVNIYPTVTTTANNTTTATVVAPTAAIATFAQNAQPAANVNQQTAGRNVAIGDLFRRAINPNPNEIPTSRYGHTAVVVRERSYDQKLLIFGGNTIAGNVNHLYEFDLVKRSWKFITPKSTADDKSGESVFWPNKTVYHSAIVRPAEKYLDTPYPNFDRMIIFGGTPTKHQILDDLYEYNIGNNQWKKLQVSTECTASPTPRRSASAIYHRKTDTMTVFGGFNGNTGSNYLNDCWQYHFETCMWVRMETKYQTSKGTVEDVPALHGHTAVLTTDESEMIVIGSSNEDPIVQLYCYNFEKKQWYLRRISPNDYVPASRKHFSSIVYYDNDTNMEYIIVFGGIGLYKKQIDSYAIFNLQTNKWSKIAIDVNNIVPPSKAWHSLVFANAHRPEFILYGGKCENMKRVSEIYSLRIKNFMHDNALLPNSTMGLTSISKLFGEFGKKFSDVKIVSMDGVEYDCHKCILASRIPFFMQLFGSEFADANSESINLEVPSTALNIILKYAYCEQRIRLEKGNALETLIQVAKAANMLMIDELEELCILNIKDRVSKSNALQILQFARKHGGRAEALKERAFDRLSKGDLSSLIEQFLDAHESIMESQQSTPITSSPSSAMLNKSAMFRTPPQSSEHGLTSRKRPSSSGLKEEDSDSGTDTEDDRETKKIKRS